MADWKDTIRERLWQNISALDLPEEQKRDLLAVEVAKAVAETEAFVGLGFITDDGALWAVQKIPNLTDNQRAQMLAEEAARLVREKQAAEPELSAAQKWALEEGLKDSF